MKVALIVAVVAVGAGVPLAVELAQHDEPTCSGDPRHMFHPYVGSAAAVEWTTVPGHESFPEVADALASLAAGDDSAEVILTKSRSEQLVQALEAAAPHDEDGFGETTVPTVISSHGVLAMHVKLVRC